MATAATLSFTVPGRPIPKARARDGRSGRSSRRHFYTPAQTKTYETKVAIFAKQARTHWENVQDQTWPQDALYSLHTTLYMLGAAPDGSNVLKSIEDACQRILWENDRQVKDTRASIMPARRRSEEWAAVEVRILDGKPADRTERPAGGIRK